MKLDVPDNDNDNNVGDNDIKNNDENNENDEEKKTDVENDEDDDKEEKEMNMKEVGNDWNADPPTGIQQHQAVAIEDDNVVLPSANLSNFDDVYMKNSTNVHLGNNTVDQIPARIIKKFVYKPLAKRINSLLSDSDENILDLPTNKANELRQINTFCKVTQWCTWKYVAKLVILVLILMCSMEIYNRYFLEIPGSSLEEDSTLKSLVKMDLVEWNEWGVQPPLRKLNLPVPYVIISHTATDNCTTKLECISRLTQIHKKLRKWSDISYNFFVGGDGYTYVGKDWQYVGAHTFGYNNRSIGISFIGNFSCITPSKVQLYATRKVIEIGVNYGKIAPNYKLLGQRQVLKTLSPGEALYDILKSWPHWAFTP
ncbi:peptidoglycan-recognition protein LE-like [Odontomachus brunneus]|uniref:peptidoglycan-recognition protein LE-like n=1 Tax=Odontomachus brunneus TaxID=486640 RepID=UPI0013F1DAE8|nr:peptidoglycan-recognition protein LE-like [Odontomachus brunneus]